MVFCAAEPKQDLILIRRNAKWLEEQQIKDGSRAGMWSYPKPGAPNVGDNSNTQFALLGLYEAERAGVPVNDKIWRLALNHWQKSQNPDGSWGYEPDFPRGHRQHDQRGDRLDDHRVRRAEPRRRHGSGRHGDRAAARSSPTSRWTTRLAWLDRQFFGLSQSAQFDRRGCSIICTASSGPAA